ncbi:MAG: glycosyltransferase family 2 protein [Bacteroidales bacterium]|nr:glycosyltransferase family 2 protein [Bacteroidales bacterium]
MIKVSIIVPLFNSESHLEALVANIAQQTLHDIEVVFVDDHGGDNSIEVARALTEKLDTRIKFTFVETPKNMGPGGARNIGISCAEGQYVAFLDSDDLLNATFCEDLYKTAAKWGADLAFCNIQLRPDRIGRNPKVESGDFTPERRNWFMLRYKSYFTTFIYRKAMIDRYEIRFPNTRSCEDSCFLASALICAQRVARVDKPLYIYQQRPDSISKSVNPDRYKDRLSSFDALVSFARSQELYGPNRTLIEFLYVKKALLQSGMEYISFPGKKDRPRLKEMRNHCVGKIGEYRGNQYFRHNIPLRFLDFVLFGK